MLILNKYTILTTNKQYKMECTQLLYKSNTVCDMHNITLRYFIFDVRLSYTDEFDKRSYYL